MMSWWLIQEPGEECALSPTHIQLDDQSQEGPTDPSYSQKEGGPEAQAQQGLGELGPEPRPVPLCGSHISRVVY